MWTKFRNWFLHKFDSHCELCWHEEQSRRFCTNCDTLKQVIDSQRLEIAKLTDALTYRAPENEPVNVKELPKPISRLVPWSVQQERLERKSREEFELRQKAAEESKPVEKVSTIEELEKVAGVENG